MPGQTIFLSELTQDKSSAPTFSACKEVSYTFRYISVSKYVNRKRHDMSLNLRPSEFLRRSFFKTALQAPVGLSWAGLTGGRMAVCRRFSLERPAACPSIPPGPRRGALKISRKPLTPKHKQSS
jgi:hypothetical protein